jgi:hypothetical protein
MNLTVTTAWVIVEEDEYHSLVDGILYPTEAEATRQMSLFTQYTEHYHPQLKVVNLSDHIDAVYELGRSGPGFM